MIRVRQKGRRNLQEFLVLYEWIWFCKERKWNEILQVKYGFDRCTWISLVVLGIYQTLSYHGHALVTLYVQFLYSDWSKFDRWVHTEKLCSILRVVYFDSWSWQSFVSTCDVFNCLFLLDVQNEIQLLSRVFCYSWLVCLLGFWLRNASLVKIR